MHQILNSEKNSLQKIQKECYIQGLPHHHSAVPGGIWSISGQLIWTPEFLKPSQRAIENSIKV